MLFRYRRAIIAEYKAEYSHHFLYKDLLGQLDLEENQEPLVLKTIIKRITLLYSEPLALVTIGLL